MSRSAQSEYMDESRARSRNPHGARRVALQLACNPTRGATIAITLVAARRPADDASRSGTHGTGLAGFFLSSVEASCRCCHVHAYRGSDCCSTNSRHACRVPPVALDLGHPGDRAARQLRRERATLPESGGVGAEPSLPPPKETLIPTLEDRPRDRLERRAEAEGVVGLHVSAFARQPRASALALCATQWRRAGRRNRPAVRAAEKPARFGNEGGDETGRIGPAQRQSHNAAARRRWRRNPENRTTFLENLHSLHSA